MMQSREMKRERISTVSGWYVFLVPSKWVVGGGGGGGESMFGCEELIMCEVEVEFDWSC